MPKDEMDRKLEAIKQLLEIFKLERWIYVAINALSFVVMMWAVTSLIQKGQMGTTEIVTIFGSSGVNAFTIGHLLNTFNKAFRIVFEQDEDEEKDQEKEKDQ